MGRPQKHQERRGYTIGSRQGSLYILAGKKTRRVPTSRGTSHRSNKRPGCSICWTHPTSKEPSHHNNTTAVLYPRCHRSCRDGTLLRRCVLAGNESPSAQSPSSSQLSQHSPQSSRFICAKRGDFLRSFQSGYRRYYSRSPISGCLCQPKRCFRPPERTAPCGPPYYILSPGCNPLIL